METKKMKVKNVKVGIAILATSLATGVSLVGCGGVKYRVGTTSKICDVNVLYNKVGPELIDVSFVIRNQHVIEPIQISDEHGTYYYVPQGYSIETGDDGKEYGVKETYQVKTLYQKKFH